MKSNKSIYFAALCALMLAACSNEAPNAGLSVTVNGPCKAGEPVRFVIDGDADNIVFYSGEAGHEYNLRDRRYADNDLMVDFVTYTDQSTGGVHPNFQVLVSHDFNGVYDAASVSAANWTDITDLFTLPTQTGANTPSGTVNLRRFANVANKDALLYIAFRYFDMDGTPLRNRWVVRSINVEKITPEGASSTLASIKTAGWQNVVMSGTSQWTLPGSQLLAAGNTATSDKDMWAISKGFDVYSSVPSTGITLKNVATKLDEYNYTYTAPGVYEAVFASSSVWYNSENSAVTVVPVTITE